MKKRFFFTLLTLLGIITQAMAQEYEYVPFVREGVKWVYGYYNPFSSEIFDMPEWQQFYSFEMKGDVLIGDKYYKPVILTHYLDDEGKTKEVENFIPVYLREENKVVYAIHPDGIWYAQCPAGYGWWVSMPGNGLPLTTTNQEFILYNFNDPMALYSTAEGVGLVEYTETDILTIGCHKSKRHSYRTWYSENDNIIEGIGYDGIAGMPLYYFEIFVTGFQVTYGLSHVIEDGEIVYKGRWYDPDVHVGIDETVSDRTCRTADPNYYNLMGQPVGKDVPTSPGIYIHNGKKIVVR